MLSIMLQNHQVFYGFDGLLQLMINYNFTRIHKGNLECDKLCIVGENEQVFVTDGVNMDVRRVVHDECFISFEAVFEIIDTNMLGDKYTVEKIIVECTKRVVKSDVWYKKYLVILKKRVNASFDVYFKVLEQYMLLNQPNAERIGKKVSNLIKMAEALKHSDQAQELITAYQSFETASAILLKQL
ncbi:ORF6 [Agrotis segetum granulovirus]|uniref:ORF6 n=1 Tax=Agrotis segetum granulosis virus TaxID=10464 RepID=Q6QXC5_GVAS|nr:hypothetical protein AsGV007 [Agrotis segetum granulovirus]AAS82732.1 ORF6 [Agrotis segetum granulovirus]AHN92045.1 hypothetical protein AsGV006 [Agrotis segetum granulovirus]AKN63282.1 hypothetical protein AsGV007 [Agrotis segetum granulovirus]